MRRAKLAKLVPGGTGDAATTMGAIEFLGCKVTEASGQFGEELRKFVSAREAA